MASHPSIRKFVRERYMQGLRISTEPTEKGESELDCFHPDYKIKRLKIVPIDKFKDDTWLRIQRAKERGLIEVIYEHERALIDTIDFMKNYYLESDPTDRHEKEWRTFYNEIIDRVVLKLLLPDLEKRADQDLRENAIEFTISKVKENFMKNYLMVPPYLFQKKACHMVSIIYEMVGKPVLTAVHVNDFGDYRNHHAFSYIMIPYAEKNMIESYEADVKKLKDFIWESKAGLIIIPAQGPESRNLKKLIKEKIIDDTNTISRMGHEPWISYGNMDVPIMATQSPNYDSDLKSYPPEVKQGVSLARFKQSPLNETLRLWSEAEGENMQIINLNFHEFQDSVPKSRMIDVLRNTAVLSVNNIGVDLYHTVMNNNLQFCVPFLSGLGEIKSAEFLRKFLVNEENISFRTSTIVLPPHVHYNVVGFTNASKFKKVKGRMDHKALDCTRIHPEFYSIATKMAKSALDDDEISGENSVKAILKDPSKLRQLDLEQFSQRCESMFGKDYKSIFYFIRDELESPFRDIRGEYSEYENKIINLDTNVFFMLTGENRDNFYEGLFVPCMITRQIKEDVVACRSLTKSNWTAYLHKDNAHRKIHNLMNPGYVITGRILKIEYDRLSVSISAMEENVTEKEMQERIPQIFRPHFQVDVIKDAPMKIVTESTERYGPGNKYKMRSFKNCPSFQNITLGQAISKLRREDGDFVFRPSPRGERWLNLSIKLYGSHIVHIEINEEKVDEETSKFHVGEQEFQDLKEVEIKFIRELKKRASNLVASPKFVNLDKEVEFEDYLRKQKQSAPRSIPYGFALLPGNPQHAVLGYVPSSNYEKVRKEFLKIKSNGFFFHDKVMMTIEEVVIFFKKNFQSRAYRKYVESKKRAIPGVRLVRDIEQEPSDPVEQTMQRPPRQASEWEGDTGVDQTPFPAKTNYVGEVPQSDWNMSSHPGAQFSTHEGKEAEGWGDEPVKREAPVKKETGWGADKADDNWGGGNNNSFSQSSSRDDRGDRGDRGGFRGRFRDRDDNSGFRGGRDRDDNNGFRGGRDRDDNNGFRGGRGRGGGGGGDRSCFNCGETGHFARECPNKDSDDNRRGGRGDRGGRGGRGGRFEGGRGGRRNDDGNSWGGDTKEEGGFGDNQGSSWGAQGASSHGNDNKEGGSSWGGNNNNDNGGDSSWGNNDKKDAFSRVGNNNKDDGGDSSWGSKKPNDNKGEGSSWGN